MRGTYSTCVWGAPCMYVQYNAPANLLDQRKPLKGGETLSCGVGEAASRLRLGLLRMGKADLDIIE